MEGYRSGVLDVGGVKGGLILTALKVFGNRPELGEVLIRVVRMGRMSPKMSTEHLEIG